MKQLYITVIESHPDNAHEDLRLDRPFQGLVQYIDSVDLESMSKKVQNSCHFYIIDCCLSQLNFYFQQNLAES